MGGASGPDIAAERRSHKRPLPRKVGVDDGTRTHDDRDHNPGLYQLSYAHH